MANRKEQREQRLRLRCAVLADIVIAIRPIYDRQDIAPEQKAFIETIIGAALWYIPKPAEAWTGKISVGALRAFHPNSNVAKPRFSEEHIYPRKIAARMLLEDRTLDAAAMIKVFCEEYGRLHYITRDENRAVQPYQRHTVFSTSDEAYAKAGIALVQVAPEDLPRIKARKRDTIVRYLGGASKEHELGLS